MYGPAVRCKKIRRIGGGEHRNYPTPRTDGDNPILHVDAFAADISSCAVFDKGGSCARPELHSAASSRAAMAFSTARWIMVAGSSSFGDCGVTSPGAASIGGTLYGDALSKPGEEADAYLKMLRHDVATLKAGMMKN